jgi:hypothetical protein
VDPIELIVTALAVGAASASKDTAPAGVPERYAILRTMCRTRLSTRPDAELILDHYEIEPTTWRPRLEAELRAVGSDTDVELREAAEALTALAFDSGRPHEIPFDHFTRIDILPESSADRDDDSFDDPGGSKGLRGLGGDHRGD